MRRALAIAAMVVARAHEEGFSYDLFLEDGLSGVQPQQWIVDLIESGLKTNRLDYVANPAVWTVGTPECLIPGYMDLLHSIIAEAALRVPLDKEEGANADDESQA